MGKRKLTEEQRNSILSQLLGEDEEVESESESGDSEDFIVFRGSAKDFFKKFGFNPDAEEEEGDEKKSKEEPKGKSRSKYFG